MGYAIQWRNRMDNGSDKDMTKVIIIPNKGEYISRFTNALKKEGVEIKLLPSFHYSTPLNLFNLVRYRLKGYKVIHIHWLYVFPFSILMKIFTSLAHILGYRLVWTIHNIIPHECKKSDIGKSKWFYDHVDYRFINYKSNIKNVEKTLDVKLDNYKVIFHPIFDNYPNFISKEDARDLFKIPKDAKVLLSFGMIRRYKGLETFVNALEKLGDNFYGIIAGEGKDKKLVNHLKQKERQLPNLRVVDSFIPNINLQLYFNACDVVVLPYKNITTSGAVMLAYYFKKPVITVNKGAMPEVVIDNKTGILINEGSELMGAIKRIFSMDYKEMGNSAYEYAKEFTWQKLAKQTIEVYNRLQGCKK